MCIPDKNIYKPYLATIDAIVDETADVRTLRLVFADEKVVTPLPFAPASLPSTRPSVRARRPSASLPRRPAQAPSSAVFAASAG